MRIALVNVYDDRNRGACLLTWAALDLLRRAFPDARVTIVSLATDSAGADAFRHTRRRYPDARWVAPAFDGARKTDRRRARRRQPPHVRGIVA